MDLPRNHKKGERCVMDLISRQAAIDRINKQREHLQPDIYPQDKIGDAAYMVCAEFIERLPSAQPERKTGKWIEISKYNDCYLVKCSECGGDQIVMSDFCPNCGSYNGGENEV